MRNVSYLARMAVLARVLLLAAFACSLFAPSAFGERSLENLLRIARITDPMSLDPAFVINTEDLMLALLVHQPLIDVERGTNLIPRGAARWEVSQDARTFTFHLRPDVRFSNGRLVVAEDYRFQIERVVAPKTGSWQQPYFSAVRGYSDYVAGKTNHLEGLRIPKPDTLVIELDQPDVTLPVYLAGIAIPLPREDVEGPGGDPGRRPVGCGPYRLVEWRRGMRLVFERNPHAIASPDRRFERIELEVGGDETTHLMRFERGELGIANLVGNGVPLSDLARLSRNPRWGPLIEVLPGLNTAYVSLNTEMPPLDDRRVRQALNYAVNRPLRMLVRQRQFIPARSALPPMMPGHDDSIQGYDYNPEKARRLLTQAGIPLPIRMTLWHPNDQRNRMVAEGVQADLHDIQVEVDLRATSFTEMLEVTGRRGRVHMALFLFNPAPDPRDVIATMFDGAVLHETEPFNVSFYYNPEVSQLIRAAAGLVRNVDRFALLNRAERRVVEDAPWLFLGHANIFLLRQPWLKGPILEPSGVYRLDRAWREP